MYGNWVYVLGEEYLLFLFSVIAGQRNWSVAPTHCFAEVLLTIVWCHVVLTKIGCGLGKFVATSLLSTAAEIQQSIFFHQPVMGVLSRL